HRFDRRPRPRVRAARRPVNPASRVARAIEEATGESFQPIRAEPVGGGCIHTALSLEGETPRGRRRYFAKVNEAESAAMFAAEADGLAALAAAGAIESPAVVARGKDEECSWLVLEWLDLAPLDARAAAALGERLAALHRVSQARFGWERDNFIGATPQVN